MEVDGRTCFQSDQVMLPSGMYFGLSAASFDSPDSFEVFSFKTQGSGTGPAPNNPPPSQEITPQSQKPPIRMNTPPQRESAPNSPPSRVTADGEQIRLLVSIL